MIGQTLDLLQVARSGYGGHVGSTSMNQSGNWVWYCRHYDFIVPNLRNILRTTLGYTYYLFSSRGNIFFVHKEIRVSWSKSTWAYEQDFMVIC